MEEGGVRSCHKTRVDNRVQKRLRPIGSRNLSGRTPNLSQVVGALLQRLFEQHCLVILPCTLLLTGHSKKLLELRHLMEQRLLI